MITRLLQKLGRIVPGFSHSQRFCVTVVLAAFALVCAPYSHAQAPVSLIDSRVAGGDLGIDLGMNLNDTASSQFEMGGTAHTLQSIDIVIGNGNGNPATVTIALHADSGADSPGALIETLAPNPFPLPLPAAVVEHSFTASGATVLMPNTKYWVRMTVVSQVGVSNARADLTANQTHTGTETHHGNVFYNGLGLGIPNSGFKMHIQGTTAPPPNTVTWGSDTGISGDADVSTNGALVYAYSLSVTTTATVNGVTFVADNPESQSLGTDVTLGSGQGTGSTWGKNDSAFAGFSPPFTSLSGGYQDLLRGAGFAGSSTPDTYTVTLNNLTSGDDYEVQLWVNDSRSFAVVRNMDVDSGPNLAFNAGGVGEFVTGTFTAVGTSQSFDLTAASPNPVQLNALQLRNTSADTTPPNPPTGLDLAAGSDSGSSDSDDITSDDTPEIGGDAETGSTVTLTSDLDGVIGSGTASSPFAITTSALQDGTHSITATATDAAGNTSSPSAPLSVVIDTGDPMLVGLPGPVVVSTAIGETTAPANWIAPTATDAIDSSPTVAQTAGGASGTNFNAGITTVTYEATDAAGNTAAGSFPVQVVETRNSPATADFNIERVRKEDSPPGGPKGSNYNIINHALVNNSGHFVLEATLAGGATTTANNLGVWSNGASGVLGLCALEGMDPSGAFTGTTFKSFDHIGLSNTGAANLSARVNGATTADDKGFFTELVNGTLTDAVRTQGTAPGTGGGLFKVIDFPSFAEGLTAFAGQLDLSSPGVGGGNDRGIWTYDGTTTSLAVREGDMVNVTGVAPAAVYGQLKGRVVACSLDTIAFATNVTGNGTGGSVLLSGSPGALTLVATKNQVVGGATITDFAGESLSPDGDVVFRANVAGLSSANTAIFTNQGGAVELVAREGDQVPGLAVGAVFQQFKDMHALTNGDVVFYATLTGTGISSANDGTILRWEAATGQTTVLVREGDLAPGTDAGVLNLIGNFDVNDNGGIVYVATLANGIGDTITANNLGMWHSDTALGVPVLVVRKADEFDYDGAGDTRSVSGIAIDPVINGAKGTGGGRMVINDSGLTIVMITSSSGGRGAFLFGGP